MIGQLWYSSQQQSDDRTAVIFQSAAISWVSLHSVYCHITAGWLSGTASALFSSDSRFDHHHEKRLCYPDWSVNDFRQSSKRFTIHLSINITVIIPTFNLALHSPCSWYSIFKSKHYTFKHSPSSSAEVKNKWRYNSTTLYALMECVGKTFLHYTFKAKRALGFFVSNSNGIATGYGMDGPGIESRQG
jgi:hypothetical protein